MPLKEERRRQSLGEACRLRKELDAWQSDRTPQMPRYQSQITAIVGEVSAALDRVTKAIENDTLTGRTTGEVLRDYAIQDQRLIWIRYAWDYFRSKFDQRLTNEFEQVLTAADEISWSCFHTFHKSLGGTVPTAPVPYIEYDYVPSALRQDHAHILARNKSVSGGPLEGYFDSLPVPLLRLPPNIVTAPWTLALIGHETGHFLHPSLLPGGAYPVQFAASVEKAALDAGATKEQSAQWRRWSPEVFADCCFVIACGPWAIWAIAPWVMTAENSMSLPLDFYPPPVTRLHLLSYYCREISSDPLIAQAGQDLLDWLEIPPAGDDGHSRAARSVAAQASGKLPTQPPRSLPDLLQWDAGRFKKAGRVDRYAKILLELENPVPDEDSSSARDASAAAVQAHFEALQESDDVRRVERLDVLRGKVATFLAAARSPGKRSGAAPKLAKPLLASRLFETSEDELFGPAHPNRKDR